MPSSATTDVAKARRLTEAIVTKVLMILTGAKEWSLKDRSKHSGGVWSPEFVYPHDRFTKAGYEVVVATLGGVAAPIDPASLSLGLQENDQAAVDFQRDYLKRPEIEAALARPARLEHLNPDEFDVIFIPGGFGVFEDVAANPIVGRIVAKAQREDGKIVGALCSGVSALLGAQADDGSWPFAGKRMTGFPTSEMTDFGVAPGAPWLPEVQLIKAGAKYVQGQKHMDLVVVDGNLITGQNGASSKQTAQAVVDLIDKTMRGRSEPARREPGKLRDGQSSAPGPSL
jgi:putative intracellular protease/amidase